MSQNGRPVVLIADKLAQSTVDALGDSVEVRWVDGPKREELLAAVTDADALLVRSATTVDKEVFDAASKLKIVGRAGVGLDNVDIAAATERGVMVVNAPTSNIHSACEHAISLLLSTARQIPAADASLRGQEWKRSSFTGVEIYGKTIGIVGFGHIGQLFAHRLAAFETTVIAYDPYANPARAAQLGVELVDLEELMGRSDFVTIHLPKTAETQGMFDAELLAKAKPGQIIINAARGGLVNEQALADAITSGHIRGAGFDVFATEPCTDSPLFALPQVVVTPHLGASTVEAQDRAGTDVAESVLKALAGEFVPDAVNVSGGRVGEEVALWLDLARKLGLVAGKLLDKAAVALEVEARGELSTEDIDALGLSALRGLFSAVIEEPVTFVNAPRIAEDRGVKLDVTTASESLTHRSVLEVRAIGADGEAVSVIGALTGLEHVEKIVRINKRGLDLRAHGFNVFFQYTDTPGALGKVGTAFGAAGFNIDAAALSQNSEGTGATLVLRIDKPASELLVETIAQSIEAESFAVDFDA
ncbi:phosphoglycerate dehydrogenase [Corynebacterium ulcerans]|uniref:D-3-phosphoglycerate dehydrogenase n=2 Tax=Corynebacterium ulcerans TaxID=65058 RepID=A0ABD0BG39_CORUL|nr:phosphoglycerate dehydrogenase [Corynebacterium ulcerans]AKN76884.1 D-3-phosphoglycerate dehydrogenase [Corynebacterium ulcerans FRC58]KPH76594.1 3-phosphoglycerate dehydrogenase [Corynebacterium ulcerans]MBH5298783.1 phosphoglycerate dehydrogenase [Corynebacterium ulcerans]MBL4943956.1 phosphoglycerate dehydrogenase [Corynebacterium ulcerans]OIS08872.1 phosphoglycerate dehydrogenase [Corynebacterium ulcerans]